mgnify:CR=1 FL=1
MTRLVQLAALGMLAYVFGFLWFVFAMPLPAGNQTADAIVVLTGGERRIDRALDTLDRKLAPKLFVAGVDKKVRPHEFAVHYHVPAALMACCVTLDFRSTDTITNAREVAAWMEQHEIAKVRLVTSDWHMRRAAFELARATPKGTLIIRDAVTTRPSFAILVLEYNKLLARRVGLERT